jgi:hypothetical protein
MTHHYEPRLQPMSLIKLRPTQITVGYREVASKRREWRERARRDGPQFLGHHMVPVVIGPKKKIYLIDHHHLAKALHEEGVKHVLTSIVADLGHLETSEFWSLMDHFHWLYPFDADGKRCSRKTLPKTVSDLVDDPYRSLAGALRHAGGYAKDATPYSEFIWADFLRHRIGIEILNRDFNEAVNEAIKLARGMTANHLPGWCGAAD